MGSEQYDEKLNQYERTLLIENNKHRAEVAELTGQIEHEPDNARAYMKRAQVRLNWVSVREYDDDPYDEDDLIGGKEDLNRAVELEPLNIEYRLLRIHYYVDKASQWVLNDYTYLLEHTPYKDIFHAMRGAFLRNKDRLDEAIVDFENSVAYNPSNLYYRRVLYDLYTDNNQYDQALGGYSTMIAAEPQNATLYRYRAEACWRLIEYEEAVLGHKLGEYKSRAERLVTYQSQMIRDVTTAAKIDRNNQGKEHSSRSDDAVELARLNESLGVHESQQQEQVDDIPAHLDGLWDRIRGPQPIGQAQSGIAAVLDGLWDRIHGPQPLKAPRGLYARLNSVWNQTGADYRQRGLIHSRLGEYERAVADFTASIESISSTFYRVSNLNSRGFAYLKLGRYAEAVADYNEMTRLYFYAHSNQEASSASALRLGISRVSHFIAQTFDQLATSPTLLEKEQREAEIIKKIRDSEIVSITKPLVPVVSVNFVVSFASRGVAYYHLGQHEQALADYNRALELEQGEPSIFNNRANAYRELQQYDLALADYTHALTLDPAMRMLYMNRGTVYGKVGRFSEAMADLNRALKMEPNHIATNYNTACVYAWQHDAANALRYLRRALELDPSLRENAKDPEDFGWLVANNPQFAAEFRQLVGG